MSQQGAIAFLRKVVEDSSLLDQITELAKTSDDPAVAISDYAAQLGCEITGAEFTRMANDLAKIESGELRPDDLETVVGGVEAVQQDMEGELNQEYLQLQQSLQQANREFTTITNIMKTKYDMEQSSTDNVR